MCSSGDEVLHVVTSHSISIAYSSQSSELWPAAIDSADTPLLPLKGKSQNAEILLSFATSLLPTAG